jgi:hypothetical protein
MSYTPVQNRFWSDGWVRQLNALDRYLFLYLLTNGRAGRTGVYELPLDLMASESGIDERDLKGSMLHRLEPRIVYKEGWIFIVNYPKYLIGDGPKFWSGVRNSFKELPEKIQALAKDSGYPMDRLSIPYSGFSNRIEENRIDKKLADETSAPIERIRDEEPTKSEKRTKDKETIYRLFSSKEQPWWRHAQQKKAALSLYDLLGEEKVRKGLSVMRENADDKYCPQAATPFEYEEKLPALSRYVKKNGI